MAQVVKGNSGLKQAPPVTQNRTGGSGGGMIVGAVVNNKPVEVVPTVVPSAVPANPMIQAQLPPGMIAIPHQQQAVTMAAPQQQPPSLLSCPTTLNNTLANTKEKTPMCLINELARFNKIQHQYTLTDEQGPAHKKTFYVKLKLGDEEYSASGPSIKKAQHAAADIALEQTQYKHPPPKPPRGNVDGSGRWDSDSITPTVELNALAMKRGEPAVYTPLEMTPRHPHPHPPQFYPPANMDFRGMYNQRYHYPRVPAVFYVSLKVGTREFTGDGRTRQAARHNAAEKALKVLRNLPLPSSPPSSAATASQGSPEKQEEELVDGDTSASEGDGLNGLIDQKDALKSEISLVHEIALKRNMPVNFEVTRESGPPHMRTFITRCKCGELICDAEGNSKKLSKKRAAERMLDKLRELPGLPPTTTVSKPKKSQPNKKKNRNLIKVEPLNRLHSSEGSQNMKTTPDYGVGINPISRLIQIQQAKKEKEPVYTLFAERGLPRRREFVMQVTVGDQSCTGVGPNKKLAKRNAAEAMLQQLGYSRPAPQPSKPAIKTSSNDQSPPPVAGAQPADKKVTFMDANPTSPAYPPAVSVPHQAHYPMSAPARQLVPGVILMSDVQRAQAGAGGGAPYMPPQAPPHAGGVQPADMNNQKFSPQTTAAIAKELLDTGASPTAEAISNVVPAAAVPAISAVRPKQQLMYLASVLGFTVQFTDFPKGNNKNEFLSLVSLSTNPPKMIHGSGPTLEASHDMAAHTALLTLAEAGLDTVVRNGNDGAAAAGGESGATPTKQAEDKTAPANMAAGDGPHLMEEVKHANSGSDKKPSEAK